LTWCGFAAFPSYWRLIKFLDQFFHKYVMAASDPFLKSQMEQEIAEIIKADIRIRFTPEIRISFSILDMIAAEISL